MMMSIRDDPGSFKRPLFESGNCDRHFNSHPQMIARLISTLACFNVAFMTKRECLRRTFSGSTPLIFAALAAIALTGCKSIGPGTVPRDRFAYSDSISDSWKRQTLLNIVKLRYFDPPIFVDVGQIVAGYSLETTLSAGGSISSAGAVQGNSATVGGAAKYTDRPTVTYTPLTGNKFVKALM